MAVTPVISKCLERLLVKYFKPVIRDDLQFAYRPKQSTEDALMLLTNNVCQHLDTNAKNYVKGVFLDFTSEFNTINRCILIEKQCEQAMNPISSIGLSVI